MKLFLKVLFTVLFGTIVFTVVSTSIESNLFTEWNFLATIPWMKATLIDFYINTIVIFIWICYRETSIIIKIIWLAALILLGSMAATAYVLIQLFRLSPSESARNAFLITAEYETK